MTFNVDTLFLLDAVVVLGADNRIDTLWADPPTDRHFNE